MKETLDPEIRTAEKDEESGWFAEIPEGAAARAVTAYEDCPELSAEQVKRILRKA